MQHLSTRIRLGGAILLLCLSAPVAFADTLQYAGGAGTNTYGGPGVGPYKFHLNGSPATVLGICDDFGSTIPGSTTWPVVVHRITLTDLSQPTPKARYFNTTSDATKAASLVLYKRVAWLSERLLAATTDQARTEIQYAVWDTFLNPGLGDSASLPNATRRAAVDGWMKLSITAVNNGYNGGGWSVFTPSGTPNSQEILIRTPEPSAVALLALDMSGLLGLVVVLRRRFRRPE